MSRLLAFLAVAAAALAFVSPASAVVPWQPTVYVPSFICFLGHYDHPSGCRR